MESKSLKLVAVLRQLATARLAAVLLVIAGWCLITLGVAASPAPWLAPVIGGVLLAAFGLLGVDVGPSGRRRR